MIRPRKALREKRRLTQAALAEKRNVSDKTVSKWESGKGYADISLLGPLAAALGVSCHAGGFLPQYAARTAFGRSLLFILRRFSEFP